MSAFSPPRSPLRSATIGRRASGAFTFDMNSQQGGSPPRSPVLRSSSSVSLPILSPTATGVPLHSDLDGQSSVKLTASLSRGQTAEATQFCQDLLKNPSLIYDITNKVIDLSELSDLLHTYFSVNGQFAALFRWSTDSEVSSKTDTQTLFRGESLATRLFNRKVLSPDGIDYLRASLNPLVQSVMAYKSSGEGLDLVLEPIEIDAKSGTSDAQSLENLKWYLNVATTFIADLQSTHTHKLSGEVRDCLSFLRHCIQVHFGGKLDGEACIKLVTSIIFLRYICPPLTAPTTFELVPKNISTDTQSAIAKRLVSVSRFIQAVANNTAFPDGKLHNETINEFVDQNHPKLLSFVSDLTSLNFQKEPKEERRKFSSSLSSTGIRSRSSADLIASPRSSSTSNYRASVDPEIRKAEEALRNYLQIYYISKRSTSTMAEMQYKTQLDVVLEAFKDSKWRTIRSSKKQKITLMESDSHPHSQKIVGHFKADIATLYDVIKYFANFVKCCPFITQSEVIEKYDENASDWYIQTKGSLITTPRDWVFTYRTYSDDKTCVACYYSIKKEAYPPSSKFVRGNIQGSGFILERDQNDPEYTNFVAVISWNTGGSTTGKKNAGPLQGIWKAVKEIYKNTVAE